MSFLWRQAWLTFRDIELRMKLGRVTPILRIFDEAKALEFYVEFLGFKVAWRHQFAPDLPLYMEVVREGLALHLSEHHGDCSPGAALRVETTGIDELHAELTAKKYRYARPGIELKPWGSRELSVKDPFGNRLTFAETTPALTTDEFKTQVRPGPE
jgi:catechol 2,3-dioxygenase-like lactoylglutathione lyase family enzyme